MEDILRYNTTLRELDLRGNALGDAGMGPIAQALKVHENSHLAELNLGYNEIKDTGGWLPGWIKAA